MHAESRHRVGEGLDYHTLREREHLYRGLVVRVRGAAMVVSVGTGGTWSA